MSATDVEPGIAAGAADVDARGACIHHLIQAQAARTPHAVAAVSTDGTLTYAELDARAEALARRLAAAGVGPETRVGICLERSAGMLAAMLGVLKAGGAYLPLDPAYPPERLAYMLEDSGARVLVTQDSLRALLQADGATVLTLDGDPPLSDDDAEAARPAAEPRNAAYVIYTSGSTGRPKGVVVTHANAVSFFAGMDERMGGGDPGCWLAVTRIGFDIHVLELLWTLARGFRVVVHPDQERGQSEGGVAAQLARHGVTHLQCTPSLAGMLIAEAGVEALAGLERLFLGGEVLPPSLAARVHAVLPGRLTNLYGPTEATVWATSHAVNGDVGSVPIGRALANGRVHVLDDALRPLPDGAPGELFIAGEGVARGYLGRPALTAERFVPDPFGGVPGARMYRTGDRARVREDGALEYMGRLDDQVKIRGFRIELGEVEAALRDHPQVGAAAVAVRASGAGEDRLVGYVVGRDGARPTGAALRSELSRRLPDYMVPALFVPMDALPLTPSGKVDRHALPAPPERPEDLETPFVAPRTETEAVVCAIWAEVLGMRQVGAEDDVFALGAHSLAVTQTASRVRARLGVELPFGELFAARTAAALAAAVDRRRDAAAAPPAPALTAAPAGARLPLSFSQERVWFLTRLAPGTLSYNFHAGITFRGALDAEALRAALEEIIRRHEVFRTTFPEQDGRPYQQVHPPFAVEMDVTDLSAMDPAARTEEERRIQREMFIRPFPLDQLPLLRWKLLRRAKDEHLLVYMEHHVVHDGWSFNVFLRELLALYGAFREGKPSPLPEPELQFGDYAYAQRAWMESDAARAQLAFWRERLAGSSTLLELPLDRPRPAEQRFRGAAPRHELPPEMYRRLRDAARRQGVTLFALMMAAFDVLMARWSGQRDLTIGTGIANRRLGETEGMLGMFVNNVVVRARLDDDPTFAELARRVHAGVLDAADHQEIPFDALVDALRPERSLSYNPLFQAMFSFHDSAIPELRLPGLSVEVEPVLSNGTSKFDINVICIPRAEQRVGQGRPGDEDGITLIWEHSTDLFDAGTMEAMVRQYRALLDAAAAAPETPVSRLPLWGPGEHDALLAPGRSSPPAAVDTVHGRFARVAAERPDAVALVSEDEAVTYGELDARVERLARRLGALGLAPEARVGICLDRSPGLIAAMLGVLRAGGAYVPLDPAYPADRLAFMTADADVAVLVTEARLRDVLPAAEGVRVVLIDGDEDADAELPEVEAGPGSLAYVMYTSGSTGIPKGTAVEHRAIVRLVCGADYVRLDADQVVLQAAPASFDAATFEVWGALLNGGRLVLAPAGTPTLEELGRTITRHGVTTMWLTAGLFQAMTDERLEDLAGVRQLLAGGDVLAPAAVRRVRERFPSLRLINGYGPTENTTFTCCHTVDGGWSGGAVPIGTPIAGTHVYVLDGAGQPVPPCVPGELFAGGAGVARGYLARPALTAERFVPDPFSAEPGARMYRTGDRVRWKEVRECESANVRKSHGRDDSREDEPTLALSHSRTFALEFLGRADQQVKVRGFRVEPGEVEAVLARVPGVRQCAVVVHAGAGGRGLAAYVAGEVEVDALRAALRAALPEHMVPGAWTVLPALPLTPNGKVDRAALPEPGSIAADEGFVAPRTPVEEVLAGIWAELLGVERVGAADVFFTLGGHSLLAMRLVSRIRAALGAELPLRAIFESPTLAGLARRVDEALAAELPALPPIRPVDRGGELPASFAQERLWFLDRMEPGSPFYNVPLALRLSGALDRGALQRALGEVVRRHEALRTVFPDAGGRPAQAVMPFAGFDLPVEDLSWRPAEDREALAERRAAEDAARPFDLAAGPLFRARLLRLAEDDHVLLLCIHHVASDGWSLGVLFRELSVLYGAFRDGRESPLPELAVQYADFAVWQREQLRGPALEGQLAYWRARLAGAPAVLELPADHPRPAVQSYRGAREPLAFSPALLEGVRAVARAEGATVFMVLLAAFQVLLGKYAGTEDVVVGSPIAGRTRGEVEPLVGFFVNTLALRADLSGDPPFRELLRRVREATLGAYAHGDAPFEKVVEEVQPERSASHSPLVQVVFAMDEADPWQAGLPGLRASRLQPPPATSKFDLVLRLAADERGLHGTLGYATDLFEAETVRRMAGHLARVLEQAAADPGARLSALELVDADERRRVVEEWNRTEAPFPRELCIHQLFEAQAARTPDDVAVVREHETLTYRALNERANRLAHHLRALGVGPETRVGVCLERGLDLPVTLLAVMKAGGAYVPLDPAYPADRLHLTLDDAEAAVLVTQHSLRSLLPPRAGTATVVLEDARAALAAERAENPESGVEPRNLAYLIYTSGSTGRPKGVAIEHQSAVAMLCWGWNQYGADELAGMLASTSVCFDMSVFEFFTPLARGGRVILVDNALALATSAAADQVRLVETVPSAAASLLKHGALPAGVRTVNLGGELLRADLVDALYARGVERVYDMYGPSEDTTFSTCALREPGGPVHIGRVLSNSRAYVLDPSLRPVPVGVPGELYLGGAGVSRGYLGRPGLTAGRYVPDHLGGHPGARLYRSGDRVRWRPDGTLEFLGRLDHQVKIRGFRIEPGEIEAALRAQPGVAECAVVPREDRQGERRLVAYVVGGADPDDLRRRLRGILPEHMVPAAFVAMDALPLMPNGKLDRRALPAPERRRKPKARRLRPGTGVEARLAAIWRELLGVDAVGPEDNFFDLGGHSLLLAELHARLTAEMGGRMSLVELYRYPTIRALATRLREQGHDAPRRASAQPVAAPRRPADDARPAVRVAVEGPAARPAAETRAAEDAGSAIASSSTAPVRTGQVAIVGMAGRFPGADDLAAFWRNLRQGVESITFHSREALLEAGMDPALLDHPDFVPARGEMREADGFDATLFGLTPRDAEILNPQHRVFLECAWAALEHAGIDPARVGRPVGVFAGSSLNRYALALEADADLVRAVGITRIALGNDKDHLAAGTSYRLDLRGPALAVQTACSTSLVAVHLACRSLADGDCDVALAGGVSVRVPLRGGYVYAPDGILSRDGHCHTFDARGGGTVAGTGTGVVVLKRLEDALADGDTIHAVVRGSAINNDGAEKVGYTAPGVAGQAGVVARALAAAGVDPATVQYLEAHGTGTALGDAIELRALSEVLPEGHTCAIGSVKTNIGHLDAAAGVAGLIKTVLALENREIPPSLHCEIPHPEIAAGGGRVAVNTSLRRWEREGGPRRAGVSSFGIGGTNAHVVLEEAPERAPSGPSRALQLLVLSARTPTALATAAARLADHLEAEAPSLADAAFTLQTGRRELEHRLAVVCRDGREGAARLREAAGESAPRAARRPVAFLFPGLGMHHVDMARGLYDAESVFRREVDDCCAFLQPLLGTDLRQVIFAAGAGGGEGGGWDLRALLGRGAGEGAASPLDDTRLAQPALFVVEYALARLWMEWGIRPRAVMGHSLGEYVAACIAGVMGVEDALRLVALRARLIGELPAGAMTAVPLGEAALRRLLPAGLDLAAVNTPESCVVAGPVDEVEAFERLLAEQGTVSRRLAAGHAFHSRAMVPVAAELERLAAELGLRAPEIPFISNVTGTWISDAEACSPAYWARHLCRSVRFADGVAALRQEPGWALLEVGPGQTLGAWALQHPSGADDHVVFSSLRHPHNRVPDLQFLLETLGGLWRAGVEVDWAAFSAGERRHRIPLPGYAFERKRYWVDPPRAIAPAATPAQVPVDAPAPAVRIADAWENGARANESRENGARESGSAAPASVPAGAGVPARREAVLAVLKGITAELTGIEEASVDTRGDFFQAGFDSLLLLQAIQVIEKRTGARISLVELLEEITTLDALADHLDRVLPPEAVASNGKSAHTAVVAVAADGAHAVEAVSANGASAPSTAVIAAPGTGDSFASGGVIPPAAPARIVAPPAFLPAPVGSLPVGEGASAVERLAAQQMQLLAQQSALQVQLMAQQLAALGGQPVPPTSVDGAPGGWLAEPPANAPAAHPAEPAASSAPAMEVVEASANGRAVPQSPRARIQPATFTPYQPVDTEGAGGMTADQKAYLDDFIARYSARTRASKAHQARYHLPLADTRVTARFRRAWKEICYPIVCERAHGSRLVDLDGNEYVDVGMGFGCNLFGNTPDFVARAIQEQLERGYALGAQSRLAGRAAELVCELGGNERAVFCNSGTEAVMGAIRAARTVTGRSRIACFAGSYHGWADVVLGRLSPAGGGRQVRPVAPGVSPRPLEDVLLLDWDQPSSLELLARHIDEVAVVMVEPVQSRRPDIRPHAFIHELRRMTRAAGTLLHFDELITGFRILPGGAQAYFGVQADLVTYGKIVAGGLPMGVVAGTREAMSVFDGGLWSYGDDSYPTAQRTLFAGAFFKHPVSMAATCAIMEEIKRQGTPMYERLNERSDRLMARINAFFEAGGYPVTAVSFGSLFRFFCGPEVRFPDLFNFHLIHQGVYIIPETGTSFLSPVHDDDDLERVFNAVCAAAEAMRQGGFFPGAPIPPTGGGRPAVLAAASSVSTGSTGSTRSTGSTGSAGSIASAGSTETAGSMVAGDGDGRAGDGVRRLPMTEGQRQLWIESQMSTDAGLAYVESVSVRLHGTLDGDALHRAIQALFDRRDALRITLAPEGDAQLVHPPFPVELPRADFRALPAEAREAAVQAWVRQTAQRPFDLARGPLVRFSLAAIAHDEHLLLWDMHHAAVDGWSSGVLWRELDALYVAETEGRPAGLPPVPDHAAAIRAQVAAVDDDAAAQAYWRAQFADGVPVLELPTDRPRKGVRSYRGGAIRRALGAGLGGRLARAGRAHGLSPYHTVLSAVSLWLWRLTGQDDLVIGTPSAGQAAGGAAAEVVGNALNTLPLRVRVDEADTFAAHARRVRRSAVAGLQHQHFSFPRLVQALRPALDPRRPPLFAVLMNLDRAPGSRRLGTLRADAQASSGGGARVEVDLNLVELGDELLLVCDYAADLFDAATVERWLDALEQVLEQVAADPAVPLRAVRIAGQAERRPVPARAPEVRQARPAPSASNGAAPRTQTERVLAEIWAGALGRERVGVNDHFFALGGDSIRAIRVATAARRAGVEITPLHIFEHPVLSALAAAVEPPAAAAGGEDDGEADAEGDPYPLTPLQEGLLFHALSGDGAQAYQVQTALLLEGELDAPAFRRAWEAVFDRHPALRTAFLWEGLPRPMQQVARGVALPWADEDWSALPADQQEARLEQRLAEDRARGFALDRAPLMRCALYRVGDGAHWFLWNVHHLLIDGWSTALIVEEVFTLYRAWSTGGSVELSPVRPWREFVDWLQLQDTAAAERYWRGRLEGFAAPTPLAVDRPAGAPAGEPVSHRRVLDEAFAQRLQEAARRLRVTLNTVVLGAWGLLLSRYSGEDDVVFGCIVSGRPAELEGVEEMVGMFINTLPLRLRVPDGARLGAWLEEVQRAQAGARAYEYASLAQVQGWSQVPAGTPLFESLFVFQNHPAGAGAVDAAGVRIAGVRAVDRDNYPLSLTVIPGTRLVLDLAYDAGRFDADTAGRVLEHLARLLEQMAEGDDDPRLADLSLVSAGERAGMEDAWRHAEREFPRDACIHHLIAARAADTPDAPAVVHEAGMLTFAEMDARANRLAHHLRRLGVRPETRVAICVERGPDMAVAILGTLKAGGAYVPLDPAYPAERLAWMLEDSRAAVLLTHAAQADALALPDIPVVRLDADGERIGGEAAEAPESGAGAENLAYVIYTSGSTGRPKGVALHHRALVSFATDMAARLGLGAGDRFLQFASPGFDVVVEELFPAWVAGAAVVFPRGGVLWPDLLMEVMERQAVTTVELPTAYWHEWVHALVEEGGRLPASLRQVLVGGERILPERLAEWSTLGVPLVHVFGLTETACTSATLRLEAGDDGARWPNLPVGTPCGNVRLYVLDRCLHPAPAGVPGELFIGGQGVARGYLGRPALTAERFVPDPFAAEPGARAYRTGDRVRWVEGGSAEVRECVSAEVGECGSAAGDSRTDALTHSRTHALTHSRTSLLEFIGRLDHQEKIRGFRVEPGEVEAALAAVPGVREARVLVRRDPPGDPRLVAYVVGDVDADGLAAAVGGSLPAHMVPSAFVMLERLPLTAHGKLDRAALPAPGAGGPAWKADLPRDYLEVRLIQLWEQVLGVQGIGATQDFFSAGGNSLLALRLFTRINRALECDLPLSTLLSGATVRQMAAAITQQRRAPAAPASIVALQPEGTLPPLFLVHASDRNVMGYVNLVRHLGPDQPAYGIRDVGEDAARPLAQIAADHVAAMRAVQPHGPYHLVGWSFGGLVVFEMALQLQRAGEQAALVGFMDTMAPELYRAWPWDSEADLVVNLAGDIAARARRPFTLRAEDLEGLDVEEQVRRAIAALEVEDALPDHVDAHTLAEACRLVRDRDRSFADYVPARLHGTVTLFRAEVGSEHLPEFLEGYPPEERWSYAWCRHADAVEVRQVPGEHATLGSEPQARVLAHEMREALAAARARSAARPGDAVDGAPAPSPEPPAITPAIPVDAYSSIPADAAVPVDVLRSADASVPGDDPIAADAVIPVDAPNPSHASTSADTGMLVDAARACGLADGQRCPAGGACGGCAHATQTDGFR